MVVTFMPHNIKAEAVKGDILLDVAASANIPIDGSCAGRGTCGSCRVQVLAGNKLNDPEPAELEHITRKELSEGWRLACRLKILDDLTVLVPDSTGGSSRKRFMSRLPADFKHEKTVSKYYVEVEPATLNNQRSDFERLMAAFNWDDDLKANGLVLRKLPDVLAFGENKITCAERDGEIISVEPGDTTGRCYGVSFDIGTTTIVGMLWNLNTGELVDVAARTNAQGAYGADVITRINFAAKNMGNLEIMRTKTIECLNDIISEFSKHANHYEIYEATVVGNTTMSHLFLGVNPAQLAIAPFTPVFCGGVTAKAQDVELNINRNGNVYLLPNIAGHVGSDIVGVMLASRLIKLGGVNIVIDVGTNGEILLGKNTVIMACSTAAGPAFEGAAIYQGMRAAKGAIERVKIEDGEVYLDVIESDEPIGICGSGLVDAISEMLRTGVIDRTGKFATKIEKTGEKLFKRIRKGANNNEFVLAYREKAEDIVITQKDVREVQLAKGAIYAGIKSLMKLQGVTDKDIKNIYIAGAFGNYINRQSALRIGLFPQIPPEKIISIGNAAGAGSAMALLSDKERYRAETEARYVEHVELSVSPDFQDEFVSSLYFPDLGEPEGSD